MYVMSNGFGGVALLNDDIHSGTKKYASLLKSYVGASPTEHHP